MPGSETDDDERARKASLLTSDALSASAATAADARAARFRDLVDAEQDAAIRTASRLLGGDPAAEDVAQEAFVRAYKGLSNFRGEASLRTWFFRILVREVQRHRRWQSVRRIWNTDSISESELPGSSPPRSDPALRDRIMEALERLPRRQREAFVLVHLEQFTVKETSVLLGVSIGTAKVHVHRALKALRIDLAEFRNSDASEPVQAKGSQGEGDPS